MKGVEGGHGGRGKPHIWQALMTIQNKCNHRHQERFKASHLTARLYIKAGLFSARFLAFFSLAERAKIEVSQRGKGGGGLKLRSSLTSRSLP